MESILSAGALSLRDSILFDVFGALLVHAFYKKYELDPSHLVLTAILLGGVPTISAAFISVHSGSLFLAVLASFALFYASLLSSIVVYRISFLHPLYSYPGPFLTKISKFYGVWIMSKGKNHTYHKELHDRYGPYVRVGPNELSVVDADHLSAILGAEGLPKGPMWDARRNPYGTRSLIAIRDTQEHSRRRKPWNRAFSTASVKGYEPILVKRALQLVGELEKRSRQKGGDYEVSAVNLSDWMGRFTFDFMGDMAFGGGFETMRDGVDNVPIWHAIEGGMKSLAMIQHLPWLIRILHLIPGSTKNVDVLRKHSTEATMRRKIDGSHARDLFHHLIDEEGLEKEPPTNEAVLSDGILAIVAGSDTTATVLSGLFYNLLLHRDDYIRLQQEVDVYFPPGEGDSVDASKLMEMPFLNAVINEALRLSPPANILQRGTTVDTGGKWFGTNYIPEGTAIDVPIYTVFRDARYFSPAPEEFWPDRWLQAGMKRRTPKQAVSAGASTMNAAAFIPFSYGPANCAGRNLAVHEPRVVVALMMQRFEMRIEGGYDPKDWEEKLQDWFVMKIGSLPVVLTSRI